MRTTVFPIGVNVNYTVDQSSRLNMASPRRFQSLIQTRSGGARLAQAKLEDKLKLKRMLREKMWTTKSARVAQALLLTPPLDHPLQRILPKKKKKSKTKKMKKKTRNAKVATKKEAKTRDRFEEHVFRRRWLKDTKGY
ncbi:hypothetical protein WMY93_008549 [Mugilogobius chulae]|uniref:Uncharacterized protein n=1 Tax=Mugilogobius chulae TaxID=88201 RepID=A0AAW0PG92_9GOBI